MKSIIFYWLAVFLLSIFSSCNSTRCNCKNHVRNFIYIEPRYNKYAFESRRYADYKPYTSFDSLPLNKINKHIKLIIACTDVKICLPSYSLTFGLSDTQVESYRQWIKSNCHKEYEKYYTPPDSTYIYTKYGQRKKEE